MYLYVSVLYILRYGLEALLNLSIKHPALSVVPSVLCLLGFCVFVDFHLVASWVAGSGILVTGCGLCPRVVPVPVLGSKV